MAIKINIEFEDIELDYLLQVIKKRYHIDFSNYRRAYLFRRVYRRMSIDSIHSITGLAELVLHDTEYAQKLIKDISINVSDMFRDPTFFLDLRSTIIPILKTYPNVKIWHAGCSTGEEVISLAIILKEEGLYQRCKILATDIDEDILALAKNAIYPVSRIKQWTENYFESGGKNSFSEYYHVRYDKANFIPELFDNVEFKIHNLTSKAYPKKFHLILCRNVLIYFDKTLQEYVIKNFTDSLYNEGFLGIGSKESIRDNEKRLKSLGKNQIYRKNENV